MIDTPPPIHPSIEKETAAFLLWWRKQCKAEATTEDAPVYKTGITALDEYGGIRYTYDYNGDHKYVTLATVTQKHRAQGVDYLGKQTPTLRCLLRVWSKLLVGAGHMSEDDYFKYLPKLHEPEASEAPSHPLLAEFDPQSAQWEPTRHSDGSPAALEIGRAANGLVALRVADEPEGDILIYTKEEWEAFVAGVKDGEFDLETYETDKRDETSQNEEK